MPPASETAAATAMQPRIAPDDPEWYLDDVHRAYAWLREHDPVHRYDPGDMWLLSRYEDIRAISRDPETFSSQNGILVNDPVRGIGWTEAPSIIYMDPPDHRRYRALVTSAFTPKVLRDLEARIEALTGQLLDDVDAAGGDVVDAIEALAVPLPVLVIAEMLGVPPEDREDFKRWSDDAILAADEGVGDGMTELSLYLVEHLKQHARLREEGRAPNDILTKLVEADVDGQTLTAGEIVIMGVTLLVAGNETTRNLISGTIEALSDHPDQRDHLADNPDVIPTAVEEFLRWVTPVKTFARTATRDTEVGGVAIPEGGYLVMLYASGNRDEAIWGPTAGRFDVTRPVEPHVAFGFGEHYCLGANLARMEARILFEQLLARFPRFTVDGPVERLRSTLMNGITHLPVRFSP